MTLVLPHSLGLLRHSGGCSNYASVPGREIMALLCSWENQHCSTVYIRSKQLTQGPEASIGSGQASSLRLRIMALLTEETEFPLDMRGETIFPLLRWDSPGNEWEGTLKTWSWTVGLAHWCSLLCYSHNSVIESSWCHSCGWSCQVQTQRGGAVAKGVCWVWWSESHPWNSWWKMRAPQNCPLVPTCWVRHALGYTWMCFHTHTPTHHRYTINTTTPNSNKHF